MNIKEENISHKYIWLQPECCACQDSGQMWCKDPDPVDCEHGKEWTKYIRYDEYEDLERRVNQLQDKISFERDNNLVDYGRLEDR